MAILLLPVRLPVYRLRKQAFRQRYSTAARPEASCGPVDVSEAKVQSPFTSALPAPEQVDGLKSLFDEVNAQLRGNLRLSGGRSLPVDPGSLDQLEDAEDRHAYHRLRWAVRYARAAAYGHAGALEALAAAMQPWFAKDWSADPCYGSPYTVAERIASLAECLVWAPGLRVAEWKKQIVEDARRLSSGIEYHLGLHNHLLNDARGLYIASAAVRECKEAGAWREQAFSLWNELFPKLVLEDGTFGEQSSHYHLLLCRTALEYWLGARASGHTVAAGFVETLQKMFQLADDLVRKDGSLARFGDNSPDGTAEDLSGLLSAAWSHGVLSGPPRHAAVTPLTLYYCASKPAVPPRKPEEPVRLYPAGGFAILRNRECELTVHGDPRAVNAAHGDAGRGSFELCHRNTVLIRQPGSCWSSDSRRRQSRLGKAQNATCLNGLGPGMRAEDRNYLPAWYSMQGGVWEKLSESCVRFHWHGFQRIRPDLVCIRTWLFEQSGDLLFEEQIEGAGKVEFESYLCLGDSAWGGLDWDQAVGRGVLSHAHAEMTIQAAPDTVVRIEPFQYLPEYGVERNGRRVRLSGQQTLPFRWQVRWSFKG